MELKLDPRLSQKLVMTSQLQQAIKLLQCSRLELQQALAHHVMENPLLEEANADVDEEDGVPSEEPQSGLREEIVGEGDAGDEGGGEDAKELSEPLSPDGWDDYYDSDGPADRGGAQVSAGGVPAYDQTVQNPTTLQGHLLWQLRLSSANEEDNAIGLMLIGNLDDNGYLRTSLEDIAEEARVSVNTVDSVLSLIHTFDPVGVAARDLRECLSIQLRRLHPMRIGDDAPHGSRRQDDLLALILNDHLRDIQRKRYDRVAKAVGRPMQEIYEAVRVIESLEPKPGRSYGADANHIIVPDVFVRKDEGAWQVVLNEEGMPRVRISHAYERMLDGGDGPATKAYLKDKLRSARWLLSSIEKRNSTILKVVRSLIGFQEPFLEKGIRHLKPCALKHVAEDVGMHESTISRVTRNKYMHCPQGLLELKCFFSAGIGCSTPGGESISSHSVRELIRDMVRQEDRANPLEDQEIASRLRHRGMVIANRSVTTYRTELRLPPAGQRKRAHACVVPVEGGKAAAARGNASKREKTALGLKLEALLRETGVTRKALMRALHTTPSGMSSVVRQSVWKAGTLETISACLKVPRSTFLACYRREDAQVQKNLRRIMDTRGLTLAELAGQSGIPVPVMNEYMSTRKMQKRTQERIAVILGVSRAALTTGEGIASANRAPGDAPGRINGSAPDGPGSNTPVCDAWPDARGGLQ